MRKGSFIVIALLAGSVLAEEAKLTLVLKQRPLKHAAEWVAEQTGLQVEVSDSVAELLVTVDLEEVSAEAALAALAESAATDAEVVKVADGKYRIRRKGEDDTPEAKIERSLAGKSVDLDFEGASLDDVLGFLGGVAGITMTLDPAARKEKAADELLVNLKAEGVSLRNALDLVTLVKGLAWDVRWGTVFVASAERLKALPKTVLPLPGKDAPEWETKLRKALAGGISFAFDGATLKDALDFVRAMKGVNLVLAPEAAEIAESAVLSLSVSDVPLGDALALMLLPRELSYRLESEVILVVKR